MSDLEYSQKLLAIGDKQGAERVLIPLLRSDINNTEAWLLLAEALDDQERKADCCRQVIRIDPNNMVAQQELRKIVTAISQKPDQAAQPVAVSPMNREAPREKEKFPSPPEPKPVESTQKANSFARKLGVSPKEWKILVGAVFATICLIAVFSGFAIIKTVQYDAQATQTAVAAAATASAHLTCRLQFEEEMTGIFSRFFRQQDIAGVTARINLPEQISHLEEIRNEAWGMKSKSCNPEIHARFMDYLDKSIFYHIAFSADDFDWKDAYVESLESLISLDDAVIANGHPGGLVEIFRARGYFYWELLDDPNWKKSISG